MLTVALFIVARKWKQSKYPSIGEWINKVLYIHKIEYYSSIKRNRLQIQATKQWISKYYAKWKKPDTKDYMLHHFIYMKFPEKANFTETENRWVDAWGQEWKQGLTANRHTRVFWDDGIVPKLDCGESSTVL